MIDGKVKIKIDDQEFAESLEFEEDECDDVDIVWPLPVWWNNPRYKLVRILKKEEQL